MQQKKKGERQNEIESSVLNLLIPKIEIDYRGEKRNMGSKIRQLIERQKILT